MRLHLIVQFITNVLLIFVNYVIIDGSDYLVRTY